MDGKGVNIQSQGEIATHIEAIKLGDSYTDPNGRLTKMSGTTKTKRAILEAIFENRIGFFITTNLSMNDVYETHRKMGKNVADQTNVLAWVSNDASRYSSYIHHAPQTPQWHHIHQDSVSNIQIQIRDEDGRVLNENEIRDFIISLDFEVEHHAPYSKEFLAKRYADAYRSAHSTQAIS